MTEPKGTTMCIGVQGGALTLRCKSELASSRDIESIDESAARQAEVSRRVSFHCSTTAISCVSTISLRSKSISNRAGARSAHMQGTRVQDVSSGLLKTGLPRAG